MADKARGFHTQIPRTEEHPTAQIEQLVDKDHAGAAHNSTKADWRPQASGQYQNNTQRE